MHDRHIYTVYGTDARKMTYQLMEAAQIAKEIPSGARISLKPNLVVSEPPETGATTHKGILEGAIEYLHEYGFTDISIIEGSWVGDSTQRGFSVCGYTEIGKKYNIPLYDLKKDTTRTLQTPIGPMRICSKALDTQYLISLPVLKGHGQTKMTCCLKNSKGCLPDAEKRRFHTLGLHSPIAALATVLHPSLYIVDSLCGDLNFEEGGNPVQTNRMLLAHDPVQMDTYGCHLMGIDPSSVPYIGMAEKWGAGSSEISKEDFIFLNEPSSASVPYSRPSGLVQRLTRNVRQDSACSACYGNLVHALYRMEEEENISISTLPKICIGQGYATKQPDGIGIGNCCKNATKCIHGCPPDSDAILDFLLNNCNA